MKNKYIIAPGIAVMCSAVILSSYASSDKKEDALVITASGFTQQPRSAPASASVITSEQLQKKPVSNLVDAVKDVERTSITGGNEKSDISIHGLSGDYTLILVDERRQSGRESRPNGSGGFEAGFIPPVGAIERIEVICGPMSSLYGSSATGGVINIIIKPVNNQTWNGVLGLGGIIQEHGKLGNSTTNDFYLSGPLIKDKLGLQLYGGMNYHKEDSISQGTPTKDDKNITVTLQFTPTESQKLVFEYGKNNQAHTLTPGESLDAWTMRGSLRQPNSERETHSSRSHWVAAWNAQGEILHPEIAVYQERVTRKVKSGKKDKYNHRDPNYEPRKPEVTNTAMDAKVTTFPSENVLTTGGQFQHAELRDDSAAGKKTAETQSISIKQKAVSIENEYAATDSLALTEGLRLDNHEIYDSYWNPRLYAVYNLTDNLTLKGGIAKVLRAPSIREVSPGSGTLTQGGASIMYGNRDLKSETGAAEEIGITYSNDSGFPASTMLFNTDFKNKLTSYDIGTKDPVTGLNTFIYDNVGKTNIRGVELATQIPVYGKWHVSTNYTFTDSRRKSDDKSPSGKSLKGEPLERTPKHAANAKLERDYTQDITFYSSLNYMGKQIWAAQRNGAKVPRIRNGFTSMDIGLNYLILPDTLTNFAVLNVTDRKSEDINTIDGNWQADEGRRYWANVRVSF